MPVNTASRSSSQTSTNSHNSRSSKKNSLANISVRSFSDFKAQTSALPGSTSPTSVKRKPLPPNASPRSSLASQSERSLEDVMKASSERSATAVASGGATERKEPMRSQHRLSKRFNDTIPSFKTRSKTTPELSQARVGTSIEHPTTAGAPLWLDRDHNGSHAAQPALIRVVSSQNHEQQNNPSSRLGGPSSSRPAMFTDSLPRSVSDNSFASVQTVSPTKAKNSPPTSKFSSFFGWKSSPKTGIDSPTTPFTDASPAVSPFHAKAQTFDRSVSAPRLNAPPAIDTRAANVSHGIYNDSVHTPSQIQTQRPGGMMEELERELKEVSSELASSIRREMELEDEIDRTKADPTGELARRTSDYFSDSGSSAAKSSNADLDSRIERLEREKRKLEQEKGQLRAEYSAKLSDELRRRHEMEHQLSSMEKELSAGAAKAAADTESVERIRELETFLTETRRRLSQERQSRDNFEDLLAALRAELTQMRNSRDNLADEIVPQLKARIEGLESENGRIQQEFGYGTPPMKSAAFSSGLRRAGSVLGRSGSVKGRPHETPTEVKEIEDQRDALQKTLKNLISRHEAQRRTHERTVRRLVADRDLAMAATPTRQGFARNVANMKEEIVTLRKRADDALTQKWQCEDNLGGVKMALDRAEQETRSLRGMLESQSDPKRKESDGLGISVNGGERSAMLQAVRRSMQLAAQEKEAALKEAESYRRQAKSMADHRLARELLQSAARLDELANTLHDHLEKNIALRERLADALHKGEKEQKASTAKVVDLQSQLKGLEEQLVSAREESEHKFAHNEELAKAMDNNTSNHLSRLTLAIPTAKFTGHRAGEGIFSARSPRLNKMRSGRVETFGEATRTAALGRRVVDLENALVSADAEMKTVVQRVEKSRGEIAQLQGERDQASQGMRRLQNAIGHERQKALRLMIPA